MLGLVLRRPAVQQRASHAGPAWPWRPLLLLRLLLLLCVRPLLISLAHARVWQIQGVSPFLNSFQVSPLLKHVPSSRLPFFYRGSLRPKSATQRRRRVSVSVSAASQSCCNSANQLTNTTRIDQRQTQNISANNAVRHRIRFSVRPGGHGVQRQRQLRLFGTAGQCRRHQIQSQSPAGRGLTKRLTSRSFFGRGSRWTRRRCPAIRRPDDRRCLAAPAAIAALRPERDCPPALSARQDARRGGRRRRVSLPISMLNVQSTVRRSVDFVS